MQPRTAAIVLVAAAVLLSFGPAFCQPPQAAAPMGQATDEAKAQVISVATEAVKEAGMDVEGVNVVYDQGGQLWSETMGRITIKQGPNKGILEHGDTNNDEIIYFDYKEPLKDVWVFVNKDTGQVVEIYREE